MELIDIIVKNMLEKHKGGEEFFNHLDKEVQNEVIVEQLIDLSIDSKSSSKNIVLSGDFGRFFINYFTNTYYSENMRFIVINGGLRQGKPIDNLDYLETIIKNNTFIFIDDSFYSGTTRNAVKKEIERLGGRLNKTFVVYDGSPVKDLSVESLYRYYR